MCRSQKSNKPNWDQIGRDIDNEEQEGNDGIEKFFQVSFVWLYQLEYLKYLDDIQRCQRWGEKGYDQGILRYQYDKYKLD